MEQNVMTQWKKRSVRIGAPTNLLAALTAFLPVIWMCSTYQCWPSLELVLKAWGLTALSFGAFYIVEPVSYYAALGLTGTYLSFLSGNIGNMRLPCAALAQEATKSEPGTLQAEIVSTMSICGSIVTNLVFTTLAAIVGTAVVAVLPAFIVTALTKYAAGAIFGATFGQFAMKHPKVAVFSLGVPLILKLTTSLPSWLLIVVAVFGSVGIARLFFVQEQKKKAA